MYKNDCVIQRAGCKKLYWVSVVTKIKLTQTRKGETS